ncbi:hypothetical protein A5662_08700 [Mycobacteriaceae bacterium 1482268.1]|nr:hypothetical protein A5662_08700 [Mycobacteriaceae bacterium 1482268.1]
MTDIVRKAHLLSTAFGLMMVAAVGFENDGAALVLAMCAAAAVVAGIAVRVAATAAVLSAAAALVVSDAAPMLAALAGLSAACYLVLRYTEGESTRVMGASAPALLAALGFSFVGVLAVSFPFELPWLPLLAPLAVFGIYVLAIRPFYRAGEGKLEISSRS